MSYRERIIARSPGALAAGLVAGSLLNCLALGLFPYFFSHFYELALFPLVGAGVTVSYCVLRQFVFPSRPRKRIASRRFATTLVIALGIPIALYAARSSTRAWGASPKVLIFCIDSATWAVADPLIDAGEMPTLAAIRERGTSGVLRSTDPSFSPIVWTTIATGVSPKVHGITSFYATQNNLRSKRMWDVLEDHGYSTGVFRWLVTWPPRRTRGFVIPGILARDAASYPAEYAFLNQLRIDKKSGHSSGGLGGMMAITWQFLRTGLRLETSVACAKDLGMAMASRSKQRRHIALRKVELRLNTDVFCHLLRTTNPAYASFYDNGVDVLGHYYWKYYQPDLFPGVTEEDADAYGTAIPDFYRLVDHALAQVLDHTDPSTTVIVVSDHGQTADIEAGETDFYPRADELLAAMGLDEIYYGIALGASTFIESIETNPVARRAALEEVAERLAAIEVDDIKLLDVHLRDEDRVMIRVNKELESMDHDVDLGGHLVELGEILTAREAKSGTHNPYGIYAMRGPAIEAGSDGPELQLTDIAPTVLYLSGLPLSRELEGRVAFETITDHYRAQNSVEWVDTYGEYQIDADKISVDAETMKKLKSLGYVR